MIRTLAVATVATAALLAGCHSTSALKAEQSKLEACCTNNSQAAAAALAAAKSAQAEAQAANARSQQTQDALNRAFKHSMRK